jgi:hypoxanthine phosphoribosyltransferase
MFMGGGGSSHRPHHPAILPRIYCRIVTRRRDPWRNAREAMDITHILTAPWIFLSKRPRKAKLIAWQLSNFLPTISCGRPTLIVDDVWGSGRTITAVKNRVSAAGGFPETCVLHFNPYRNLFGRTRPDYFAAVTDAFIIYPWEIDRGEDQVLLGDLGNI